MAVGLMFWLIINQYWMIRYYIKNLSNTFIYNGRDFGATYLTDCTFLFPYLLLMLGLPSLAYNCIFILYKLQNKI